MTPSNTHNTGFLSIFNNMFGDYAETVWQYIYTVIYTGFMFITIDSIPVPADQTLITVILSPAAETGVDVWSKFMVILSSTIATMAATASLYKTVISIFKPKD